MAWRNGSLASTPGGTFTDLIAFDQMSGSLQRAKVPSVPSDPSLAVVEALGKLFAEGVMPADVAMIVHGTTVATNPLLEGKGVRAGLLITKGFRAVYEARGWSQPRGADLLDTFYQKPPLLVPQHLTEEGHRTPRLRGPSRHPARRGGIARLDTQPRGQGSRGDRRLLPVLLRQSGARAARRRNRGARGARLPHIDLERGAPVIREYPRLSTTVIDAYVGPRI